MRKALSKYWDVLKSDPILQHHVPPRPTITFRRAKNLKDILVKSHYEGKKTSPIFGAAKPRWGNKPCGRCVACKNVVSASTFSNFAGTDRYTITHTITCETMGVVYLATCPCGLKYVGMTSRQLKRRIREHVLGIEAAKNEEVLDQLKTIPRHFKQFHNSDASGLQVCGIDRVFISKRGGDWRKILAQVECKWIYKLGTVRPQGLNEGNSFVPFL